MTRGNSEKSITWAGKTNKKFKTKDIAFKGRVTEVDKQSKYITIYLYNTQIKNEKEIGRIEIYQKKKKKKMGLKPTRRKRKKQEEEEEEEGGGKNFILFYFF